jgi:hypothetical protein
MIPRYAAWSDAFLLRISIHPISWKESPPNFALRGFSEVLFFGLRDPASEASRVELLWQEKRYLLGVARLPHGELEAKGKALASGPG